MQYSVLIVDDEPKMTAMLSDYLTALGYTVETAENGSKALEYVSRQETDCIVLDIMMPGLDGLDVTRRIREFSTVPIILLTAKAREDDKLIGLEVGADDYITKPFSMKELAARIRAVLRRSRNFSKGEDSSAGDSPTLSFADLFMEPEKHKVSRGDREIGLTEAQFRILYTLASKPGRVFTRMELLHSFQDEAYEGYERTIDVHIKNLRKILGKDSGQDTYIKTVWGVGYKAPEDVDN